MPNPLPQQRFPVSPQPLGPLAVLMAACLTTIHPRPGPAARTTIALSQPLPHRVRRLRQLLPSRQGWQSPWRPCEGGQSLSTGLYGLGQLLPRYAQQSAGGHGEGWRYCPQGWSASQDYCMVPTGNKRREVIARVGRCCPTGFTPWGDYCLGSPNQEREAVLRVGRLCPPGWPRFGA